MTESISFLLSNENNGQGNWWWRYAECKKEAQNDPRIPHIFDLDKETIVTELNKKGKEVEMSKRRRIAVAKEICRRCDVRADCLEDALKYTDFSGVRGNTTPEERYKLYSSNRGRTR